VAIPVYNHNRSRFNDLFAPLAQQSWKHIPGHTYGPWPVGQQMSLLLYHFSSVSCVTISAAFGSILCLAQALCHHLRHCLHVRTLTSDDSSSLVGSYIECQTLAAANISLPVNDSCILVLTLGSNLLEHFREMCGLVLFAPPTLD